jgi:hypothetical protein
MATVEAPLKTGTRIDVWVEGWGGPFQAHVEEVSGHTLRVWGIPVPLEKGRRVRARIRRGDGVYWFVTHAILPKLDPGGVATLAAPERFERVELRRYPRHGARFPAYYRYLDQERAPMHGWRSAETRDANEQAVRLVFRRPFLAPVPGQTVEVAVRTPAGPFTFTGWIVRAGKVQRSAGDFEVVVRFEDEISGGMRRRLVRAFAAVARSAGSNAAKGR